jgi:hypothetical protein
LGKGTKKIGEDPAWKQRRRELDRALRKGKITKILSWSGVGLLIVLFIALQIHSVSAVRTMRKAADKGKPHHGIARVLEKKIVTKDGKKEWVVSFVVSRWAADKKVDEQTFKSLKKDQQVFMTYDVDPTTDQVTIRDWNTKIK